MAKRNIIVVGASAGGIQASKKLLAQLPRDFPASIFIVIHIPAETPSILPEIFNRISPVIACHPSHLEKPRPGVVYVAWPNRHLLLGNQVIRLGRGPRENGHRPAIDPLFRTAASTCGARAIGIILSGTLDDGSAGLEWIHQHGGVTIAQDPREAEFPDMPENAIKNGHVEHVLPISEIAALLMKLVAEEVPWEENAVQDESHYEPDKAEGVPSGRNPSEKLSDRSGVYGCPDCGGPLWEVEAGEKLVRYECRVGHEYSEETLLVNQSEGIEAAFWTVLRTLEENVSLLRRSHARSVELGHIHAPSRYEAEIRKAEQRIALVRRALLSREFDQGSKSLASEKTDERVEEA